MPLGSLLKLISIYEEITMKLLITIALMVGWSILVWYVMNMAGFTATAHLHDPLWSLGAAIVLLIGLIGNVWIFFLMMKDSPWQWANQR